LGGKLVSRHENYLQPDEPFHGRTGQQGTDTEKLLLGAEGKINTFFPR
jgi:hypothetical protein